MLNAKNGSGIRRALIAALAVAAAGCSATGGSGPVIADRGAPAAPVVIDPFPIDPDTTEQRSYDRRAFVEPLHMRGEEPVRIALLLPFSASAEPARLAASAMFDAAQLAAFEAGDARFLLLPKDTKGTADGARLAARAALADGAEIILGPLYAPAVEAAAEVAAAAEVPMIAFSSDSALARPGLFLLSFPPEEEVARVTRFAIANGMERFGLMAPATEYGSRVASAFAQEIAIGGGALVHEERYEQNVDAMRDPARRLAQYSREVVPVELRHDYDPNKQASSDEGYVRGYQAVMVPEQGTLLRALAPLFPYYNVNIEKVKLLGVSAWNNPRLIREPALRGGWFAAPEPEISVEFQERFEAAFGESPPRAASLAYDATLLAARLARNPRTDDRFQPAAIADPNGYFGADGLFRFRSDGTIERGLAILEIQPGGVQLIDPAPRSFAPSYSSSY